MTENAARDLYDALDKITVFSGLSADELDALTKRMKEMSFQKGGVIFREGDRGEELYAIIEGVVKASMTLPTGKEFALADFTAGSFFGDMSIIENEPRSATCTAGTDCRLASLSRNDFNDLIESHPETATKIMFRMLNIISGRLNATGSVLSEMVRWGENARKRSITDEFTGLFNRRFFDESLATCIARAKAEGKPLSFVMIDMDRFGQFNKEYGEAFGDALILAASRVFKGSFRSTDILARYGGDEFSFLLPDTDSRKALELCGVMAENLRAVKFADHPEVRITLSMGIAALPEHAGNAAALKEAADRAVYMAKEAGRDRALIAARQGSGRF